MAGQINGEQAVVLVNEWSDETRRKVLHYLLGYLGAPVHDIIGRAYMHGTRDAAINYGVALHLLRDGNDQC